MKPFTKVVHRAHTFVICDMKTIQLNCLKIFGHIQALINYSHQRSVHIIADAEVPLMMWHVSGKFGSFNVDDFQAEITKQREAYTSRHAGVVLNVVLPNANLRRSKKS